MYFRMLHPGVSVKGCVEGFRSAGREAVILIHAETDNGRHWGSGDGVERMREISQIFKRER